jgi:microcystin degradation protein MlrC
VEWVGEASFENTGSYMTGFTTCMGLTGVIRVGGLRIVATSLRTMPFDRGVLTSVGIEPEAETIIVVKAAIAWRAAFEEIAKRTLIVDTPGICPANLEQLEYRQGGASLWPLNRNLTYDGRNQ